MAHKLWRDPMHRSSSYEILCEEDLVEYLMGRRRPKRGRPQEKIL